MLTCQSRPGDAGIANHATLIGGSLTQTGLGFLRATLAGWTRVERGLARARPAGSG